MGVDKWMCGRVWINGYVKNVDVNALVDDVCG